MSLSQKLLLRPSQNLVFTPRLQQAIHLLQLSNMELERLVDIEVEKNPFLKKESYPPESFTPDSSTPDSSTLSSGLENPRGSGEAKSGEARKSTSEESSEEKNVPVAFPQSHDSTNFQKTAFKTSRRQKSISFVENVVAPATITEHLQQQLIMTVRDSHERLVAGMLINCVDESGYLTQSVAEISQQLGIASEKVEAVLRKVQKFDPTGVFARDLKECLTLQLQEKNQLRAPMKIILEHLDMLAGYNLPRLARRCGLTLAKLQEEIALIKKCNPKPGLAFGGEAVMPIIPDVFVRRLSKNKLHVELNGDTLPRVLMDKTYIATVRNTSFSSKEKSYVAQCMNNARWFMRILHQRAQTVLKVSKTIVKSQQDFFHLGAMHLAPLTLKEVAQAIDMHESTVSRVTSNKTMATPYGTFPMKHFFTTALANCEGVPLHATPRVRYYIKKIIAEETAQNILSDGDIAARLKQDKKVVIARRTVAKYREEENIPSSAMRRRMKKNI